MQTTEQVRFGTDATVGELVAFHRDVRQALRERVLATPTFADSAWNADFAPRQDGESREAYIGPGLDRTYGEAPCGSPSPPRA
jgi:hypothetical protein